MNCLECRRRLLTAPLDRDEELRQHLDICESCEHEAERAWEFEGKLHNALFTAAQPGLEERILLARLLKRQRISSPLRHWVMAAGLALGLGLAGWFAHGLLNDADPSSALSIAVIEHIQDEPEVLEKKHPITVEGLDQLLSHFGARLTGDLGRVNYAGRCRFMHSEAVHMVLQGINGPVTVMLMPENPLQRVEHVDREGFSGTLLPMHHGSLAVISEHPEPVDAMVERVGRAVSWKI